METSIGFGKQPQTYRWEGSHMCWHYRIRVLACLLPPATKLRQGNVFYTCLSVILFTGGSLPACTTGHMTRGVSVHGGLCPWGSLSRGVSVLCPGESLSRRISVWGVPVRGVSVWRVSVQGSLSGGRPDLPYGNAPVRYASYWNAFLFPT